MTNSKFNYIFGPVYSWRLGTSLGIDPISSKEKVCNFNCIYCQLGRTSKLANERKNFVEVKDVIDEIKLMPEIEVDYYTFSGRGEPTLAKNLGEMIIASKDLRIGKTAVITNSSLLDRDDVKNDLMNADFVLAKLDAFDQQSLKDINSPFDEVKFDNIIKGIKDFKNMFKGKLALQVMFIDRNVSHSKQIADLAKEINPDEVQINTPLRLCGVKPLSREQIASIKGNFDGLNVKTVYEAEEKIVKPINDENTAFRHGKTNKYEAL